MNWILNSMEDSCIAYSFRHCNKARELWDPIASANSHKKNNERNL